MFYIIINLIKKACYNRVDSLSSLRFNIYLEKRFETIKGKFVAHRRDRTFRCENFASNRIRDVNSISESIMIGKRRPFAFELINFAKYTIASQVDKESR